MDEEERRARKVRPFSPSVYTQYKYTNDPALKAARTRAERTTAAAHARNKATFNPQASASASTSKRRVAFAKDAVQNPEDAEASASPAKAQGTGKGIVVKKGKEKGTGKWGKGKGKGKDKEKRHSRRSHTVLNTSETALRMKTAAQRRVRHSRQIPNLFSLTYLPIPI